MQYAGVILVQHPSNLHEAQTSFSAEPVIDLEAAVTELLRLGVASNIYERHLMLGENLSNQYPSRPTTGEALHDPSRGRDLLVL